MRHKQGDSRQQSTLFPDRLDDYVSDDNSVRVIDAFIDSLDMAQLGFTKAVTKETGRKPYAPADLLKLYTYGYLNQVRSTRRLEKECHRNVEVLWLMRRLAPDFKTIANFRQQNSSAIQQVCRAFIQFCREANLLNSRMIAIDGSKFKAAASRSKTYNREKLDKVQNRLSRKITAYLDMLAKSEREDSEEERGSIQKALHQLRQRQKTVEALSDRMIQQGAKQCCETEPEARRMRSGRDGVVVGYNVQSAVEVETGLIIHHDVTNEGNDSAQLKPMAIAAKSELKADKLRVLADTGYSNGEQLAQCEEEDIEAVVPVKRGVNGRGDYYSKSDFSYDADQDAFTCPAGKTLNYRTSNKKTKMHLYTYNGCSTCPQKSQCTKAEKRWVSRHFHEGALERAQARVDADPGVMAQRAAVVERPFAHLKQIMGLRRFQCWGKEGARAEMGLGVLAYNLSRMINELGTERMLKLI